jgi:hypothetical protein
VTILCHARPVALFRISRAALPDLSKRSAGAIQALRSVYGATLDGQTRRPGSHAATECDRWGADGPFTAGSCAGAARHNQFPAKIAVPIASRIGPMSGTSNMRPKTVGLWTRALNRFCLPPPFYADLQAVLQPGAAVRWPRRASRRVRSAAHDGRGGGEPKDVGTQTPGVRCQHRKQTFPTGEMSQKRYWARDLQAALSKGGIGENAERGQRHHAAAFPGMGP